MIVSSEQHSRSLEVAVVAVPNLNIGRHLAHLQNTYTVFFSEGTENRSLLLLTAFFRSSGSSLCTETKDPARY